MIEISLIRDLVAIFGVIAGFSYYVLTVRATRRTQNLQLETRQAQLFNSVRSELFSHEVMLIIHEMFYMTWDDYDDFETKYGSDTNPDNYAKRTTVGHWIHNIGLLLERDYLDENLVYDAFGSVVIMMWTQWKPIFFEQRKRYFGPEYMNGFEYIGKRMIEIQKSRGTQWEPPSTKIQYIPDQ